MIHLTQMLRAKKVFLIFACGHRIFLPPFYQTISIICYSMLCTYLLFNGRISHSGLISYRYATPNPSVFNLHFTCFYSCLLSIKFHSISKSLYNYWEREREREEEQGSIMDHAVKASRSHPWNKLRFENDELEELYKRYTHKIQWISVFGVVTLVVMLTGLMAILSLAYSQIATVHVSSTMSMFPWLPWLDINFLSSRSHRMSSMAAFVSSPPSSWFY